MRRIAEDGRQKNVVLDEMNDEQGNHPSATVALFSMYVSRPELEPLATAVHSCNFDPAVAHVPFEPNIDIRDTVDYKQVMKQCVSPFPLGGLFFM